MPKVLTAPGIEPGSLVQTSIFPLEEVVLGKTSAVRKPRFWKIIRLKNQIIYLRSKYYTE